MTSAMDNKSHRSTGLSKRSVSQLSHNSNYKVGNLALHSILKPTKKLGKDKTNNVLEQSKFTLPEINKTFDMQSLASGRLFSY
jgi:hypothetical protein